MMHRDHTLKMSPKKERVYGGRFRHFGGSDSIKCNACPFFVYNYMVWGLRNLALLKENKIYFFKPLWDMRAQMFCLITYLNSII